MLSCYTLRQSAWYPSKNGQSGHSTVALCSRCRTHRQCSHNQPCFQGTSGCLFLMPTAGTSCSVNAARMVKNRIVDSCYLNKCCDCRSVLSIPAGSDPPSRHSNYQVKTCASYLSAANGTQRIRFYESNMMCSTFHCTPAPKMNDPLSDGPYAQGSNRRPPD